MPLRLKDFMYEALDKNYCCFWIDKPNQIFAVKWTHGHSKSRRSDDNFLFVAWSINKHYPIQRESMPQIKARFRVALNTITIPLKNLDTKPHLYRLFQFRD